MSKGSTGLVLFAEKALKEKWYYVYATYGQIITENIIKSCFARYPDIYDASYRTRTINGRQDIANEQVYGRVGVDCIGLIKAYLWWVGDGKNPIYVASQDKSADGMLSVAVKKGKLDSTHKIPETAGLLVHKKGHVGIYIGGGYVIEAKGADYGVVKTKLSDTNWTDWEECIFIDYVNQPPLTETRPVRSLSFGSVGLDVQWCKNKLKKLNYNVGTVNTTFDKVFDSAVRQFESDNGIVVNGIIDSATLGAIDRPNVIISQPVPVVKTNPYPRPSFAKVYNLGDVAQEVKWIQFQLQKLGYLKLNTYTLGKFDKATEQALISLQRNRYIKPNGIFGSDSNKQLVLANPIGFVNPFQKPDGVTNYRVGSVSPCVNWIRLVLFRNKYLASNNYSEKYDTELKNAVLSFQSKNGLSRDGIVGKNTSAKLFLINK